MRTWFHKDWFRSSKVAWKTHTHQGDQISLNSFFQNKESRLITEIVQIKSFIKFKYEMI